MPQSGSADLSWPIVSALQYWDIWYPKAAATGISVGRAAVDPTDTMLLHAAGDVITVEVRDSDGRRVAVGRDLVRTLESPICRLRIDGASITRDDIWPGAEEIGLPVMLPGGEAGVLLDWWNAEDRRSWRWRAEFYNQIG